MGGRGLMRYLDERTSAAPALRRAMRYVFPDHWSFLLGEIALYSFVVLVATGVFLALFYVPSLEEVTYTGSYEPLQGQTVSEAYSSVLDLSFDVTAGLLVRQTHHWAALVFVAAIVIHMLRVLYTGAYRNPREPIYYVGVTLLLVVLLEGYLGYSLLDDLLSGMGLAIGYGVALSVPLIGANLALLVWGGEFPGADDFLSRVFIAHVFVLPVLIAVLITVHLALIVLHHHAQFRGEGRREDNVVGTPMWPAYALRSTGLFLATSAALVLMGGLIQINPVWLWGPFEPWEGTNGAQPDWYLGWLIGALRLMPDWEIHLFGLTFVPNPFFGGVLFPLVISALLYLWPSIDRLVTGDRAPHHLLDRPRDAPWRTAAVTAVLVWVVAIFFAGAMDRFYVQFGVSYETMLLFWRVTVLAAPVLAFVLTRWACRELRASEAHPLRGWSGRRLRRNARGGFDAVGEEDERP